MSGEHDDYGGLHRDLHATAAAMNRRSLLRWAARAGVGLGALPLIGCGGENLTAPTVQASTSTTTAMGTATSTSTDTTVGITSCSRVPEETAGPYPGDGSNGPSVLGQSGVVRTDITSSFGGLVGTADGVALTLTMTLVSATTCEPLAGRAVYLWHCDRQGRYSLYTSGVTNQNFLRGVQATDADGRVTFTTIFPGCYTGRWPHFHFEVFPSTAAATSVSNKVATSQIALPKDVCDQVYALSTYPSSASNLSRISLASDNVFSDGVSLQLATVTGSVSGGFSASLSVAVRA